MAPRRSVRRNERSGGRKRAARRRTRRSMHRSLRWRLQPRVYVTGFWSNSELARFVRFLSERLGARLEEVITSRPDIVVLRVDDASAYHATSLTRFHSQARVIAVVGADDKQAAASAVSAGASATVPVVGAFPMIAQLVSDYCSHLRIQSPRAGRGA